MRAHKTYTSGRRNPGQIRIMTTPRVIEQVGARLDDRAGDLGPPGIDADDQRRVLFSYQSDKIGDPTDFLGSVDVRTRARLDAADVDDVGSISDREVNRPQSRVDRKRRTLIEERVRGSVDDAHDRKLAVRELARTEAQRHRLSHQRFGPLGSGTRGACHPPLTLAWHDRGVPLLFGILVAAIVIFAIFAVTIGHGGSMTQFQPDWPGKPLPEDRAVRAQDLADAQFSLAFRGYRMAEVDEALDRLAVEIAQRDEQIERLTGRPFESAPPTAPEPLTAEPTTTEPTTTEPTTTEPTTTEPTTTEPTTPEPTTPEYAGPNYNAPVPEYSTPTLEGTGPPTQPIPPVIEPGAER
jgi:DivIVA domain-containing protein